MLVSNIFRKIPVIGKALQRLIPVANYNGIYPLNQTQIREWALLDTFDMLGPSYDTPQTEVTIKKWMDEEGFNNVESLHATLLVVRGRKK